MKLIEISGNDTLTASVVNAMVTANPVLQDAEFYPINGNAEYLRKVATASGGAFRALNSAPAANKVDPEFVLASLKIFGDKVEVDQAHERRGGDIPSERARQLFNFARNFAKNFVDKLFNGAVSATDFDGLKALMPVGQVITPATDGFEVVTGNDNTAKKSQQRFVEYLQNLVGLVSGGATHLYMNYAILSRLSTIAAEYVKWERNEFGLMVPFFMGIPVRDPGYTSAGSLILTNAETCGTSANTGSVFAVRWGEKQDFTIASNKGVNVADQGLVGVHYTHLVELDAVPVLANTKAVAQLKGIILP